MFKSEFDQKCGYSKEKRRSQDIPKTLQHDISFYGSRKHQGKPRKGRKKDKRVVLVAYLGNKEYPQKGGIHFVRCVYYVG